MYQSSYSGSLPTAGHCIRRKLFVGPFGKPNAWNNGARRDLGWWKKWMSNGSKTSVRAIPLETATRSKWSGRKSVDAKLTYCQKLDPLPKV